jgi:chromosome segregation ATPase
MTQCKALTYIQNNPKKVGAYALAATAVVSVCVCGLRAMKRHGSEGTRVSLMQRVRNFVDCLGSFMHRRCRRQAQESAASEQQLRGELQQLHDACHVLDEQNTMLEKQKEELERQKIELEQQVEQQQHAYAFVLKNYQDANEGLAQNGKLISELKSELDGYDRRLACCDAKSANLRDKLAAYERREALVDAHCTQLKLKLDRLQDRIATADATTQTEYSEGTHRVVVSRDDGAPSEMPLPPSGIDFRDRRSIAESLSVIAGEGRAEVTGVLEQTRRVLELAQQRNKVDVTRTSGFGPAVGNALGTSYKPAQESGQ